MRSPSPASPPPVAAETEAPSAGYVGMGYAFAAVGALLFSTKAVIIKLAYAETIDAETLLALRMAFALPFYVAIGALSIRDRTRTGRPLPPPRQVLPHRSRSQ